jgi:hypothetical protein
VVRDKSQCRGETGVEINFFKIRNEISDIEFQLWISIFYYTMTGDFRQLFKNLQSFRQIEDETSWFRHRKKTV